MCNDAIEEAINKNFSILLIIDDYHNIHTIRRPQDENSSYKMDHMCTIIIKIIKEAPAVVLSFFNLVQNPNCFDVDLLVSTLSSVEFFKSGVQ